MLETPLFGRFQGENKRLVFSAPMPYYALIRACIGGGCGMVLYGFAVDAFGIEAPFYPVWWMGIGALVAVAGVLATLSLTSITFDLQERYYRRRQGPGLIKGLRTGSIAELDALVAIAEPNSRLLAGGVTYHLVLHWKGQAQPIMVLQQDTRMLVPGQPLNVAAQQLLSVGANYAKALGLPFYDNTHFASKCPVSIWK